MALLKFLRRPGGETPSGTSSSAASEAVAAARVQARRRLMGAIVLLGVGVIGFPLVFQTQPRPIPVDIPIDIPKRESAPPLALGQGATGGPVSRSSGSGSEPASPAPSSSKAVEPVVETASRGPSAANGPANGPAKGPANAPANGSAVGSTAASPAEIAVEKLPAAAAASPPANPTTPAGATGTPTPPTAAVDKLPEKGRFVVQAGSYTDAEAVREVRAKLERMGLKTYTQVAQIDGVSRTRVRVGPFASKSEALEVQNRIKDAGVSAALLAL